MISDEEAKSLERVANEIKDMVQGLRDDIQRAETVRDDLAKVTRSGRITRMMVIAISVILGLVLILGSIQVLTQAKLNNVVAQLNDVVRVQHDSALCPLYQIFIKADTPAARDAAARRGDDLIERDKAFATIRESYTALNCQAK